MGRGRERNKRGENNQENNHRCAMHGWDDTHEAILSPQVRCEHCASTGGAQRAQYCVLYASVCVMVFLLFIAVCSSRDVVMREGVRNDVAIIVYCKC